MSASNQMIGRTGQNLAATWASQASITANPSFHDDRGWDLFLQLSNVLEAQTVGPLDLAPPDLSCMVQVKTTTTDTTSCPISVSNWQRMVKDPVPWFVLAVQVDANLELVAAHLVHVEASWCERVLRRLRELHAQGEGDRLNHHTLDVSWMPADRLTAPFGTAINERIRSHIQPTQHEYVTEKITWFKTLGYADKRRRVEISLTASDPDLLSSELADLAIGLRSTLPGEWRATLLDVRFGIPGTIREFGRESGEIEFRPSPGARVRFQIANQARSRLLDLECDLYRARSTFPFLPAEHDKFRLVSIDPECKITALIYSPGGHGTAVEYKLSLPGDTPLSLRALRAASNLVLIVANHATDPPAFRISSDSNPAGISIFENSYPAPMAAQQLNMARVVDQALEIARAFGVDESETVALGRVTDQEGAIVSLRPMLATTTPEQLIAPCNRAIGVGETFGVVLTLILHLEHVALVGTAGIYGRVEQVERHPEQETYRITVPAATVLVDKVVLREPDIESFNLAEARTRMADRLRELGCSEITLMAREEDMEDRDGAP